MNQVFESFENLVKAQRFYSNDKKEMLDKLLFLISQPTSQNIKEIKQIAKQFTEKGKDYYSLMQKYSKSVEKKLKFDLDFVWDPKAFHDKDAILIKIIIQHFVRQGRFDIAKKLSEESNVDHEEKMSSEYSQMFQIQEQLRNENVDLAIEWATQHSRFLQEFNSSLEFQLHQMKYLKFVQSGQLKNALGYAQRILYKFADTKLSMIQKLMCTIVYAKKLDNCPYSSFFTHQTWLAVQTLFAREYNRYLGQSFESPLYTSVTVGSTALPMIMKISSLMKDKALEWTQTGELPVTIPLLESQRYHSIFVCPVTKEQGNDANPPMLILCGHVISKETLTRLSKGSLNSRFKCPYCPGESTAAQAVRVYF